MTPIIWNDETLRRQGAGRWSSIVELNPLLHYLDIVRAPLLGAHQELRHWLVVLVLTVVGWMLAAFAMRQYRARVPLLGVGTIPAAIADRLLSRGLRVTGRR